MATVYLNKNVRFKCDCGNAVYFRPVGGTSNVTVSGAAVLLDDCKLQLIGPSRPGQCPHTPNPATNSPPGLCLNKQPSGNWQSVGGIAISDKHPLSSRSSMQCLLGGASIKPFRPTCKPLTVDDSASRISVKIGAPAAESAVDPSPPGQTAQALDTDSGQVLTETREVQSPPETLSPDPGEDRQYSRMLSDKYMRCAMNRGEACETCEYRNTSHVPAETDGSKNAAALTEHLMANDYNKKEADRIEQLILEEGKTYSTAHHHLIPVNQCFKGIPELVKLANYYEYDINNALNGICLPTATDGYNGQPVERRREVAFYAMKKLKLQWHAGGHQMTIPELAAARLPKSARKYNYKEQVEDMLHKFIRSNYKTAGCRAKSFERGKKRFHSKMDEVCQKIRERVLQFSEDPRAPSCIYVSKMSLYYAFYNELKEYQDILFKNRTEAAGDE